MSRWIRDRLPSPEEYRRNDGRFIVTDGNRVEQGLFDPYADGYNELCWPFSPQGVIAWMNLPSVPKGDWVDGQSREESEI